MTIHNTPAPFIDGDAKNLVCQSRGFQTFTLHLSLQYYTMAGENQLADLRVLGKKPLRGTLDIAELGSVHESHTSTILTGVDDHRWTAIKLVDSPRKTASVKRHANRLLPGPKRKVFGPGKRTNPDDTALEPRLYFLWAWEEAIREVGYEWTRIIARVEQIVKE